MAEEVVKAVNATAERYHDVFNTIGRIPSKSVFFQNWKNIYTSSKGIYEGLNTVLGEQLINPNKKAKAPIYERFIGRPMQRGDAWMERFVLKVPNPTHYTGKEGAEEALKWYESEFSETVHKLNFAGTRSVSLTDELMENQMLLNESGSINDYIVDRMSQDIQRELEAMAGETLVMQIKNSKEEDLSTPEKIREVINEYAIDMKSENLYAERHAKTDGSLYADSVVAIMSAKTAYKLTQQPAIYPNAGVIRTEAEVLPIYGTMPSGLSAEEYAVKCGEGTAYEYYNAEGKKDNPPGVGRASPVLILLDPEYFEIRPYLQKWSMSTTRNDKGLFTNVHSHYMGAMGVKPWRSAVVIYNKTK